MEFDIKERTHFLCVTGSHAFGTATESSDIDLKGFAIPPAAYLLSPYKHFEQHDQQYKLKDYPFDTEVMSYANKYRIKTDPDEILDQSIYAVHKFFKLASDCNPNIMSILFADEENILYSDEIAKELFANRDKFLSAKVRFTYSGYAYAQLKRIRSHRKWLLNPLDHKPTREEFGLPEFSTIPADQRGAAEKLVEKISRGWILEELEIERDILFTLQQNLTEFIATLTSNHEDLAKTARLLAMKKLGMTDNFIQVLQAEKAYRAAHTEWKQYQEWVKNRNPNRAALEAQCGYDSKHAYHLVRLIRMCKEIMLTGKVIVKRPDAAELLAIRNGSWTYEELISWAEEKDKELEEIYRTKQYIVPHKPDINFLSSLCIKLHQKVFDQDRNI
jgi:uncharacterized protein